MDLIEISTNGEHGTQASPFRSWISGTTDPQHQMIATPSGWVCAVDCSGLGHLEWLDDSDRVVVRHPDFGQAITMEKVGDTYTIYADNAPVSLPESVSGLRWAE